MKELLHELESRVKSDYKNEDVSTSREVQKYFIVPAKSVCLQLHTGFSQSLALALPSKIYQLYKATRYSIDDTEEVQTICKEWRPIIVEKIQQLTQSLMNACENEMSSIEEKDTKIFNESRLVKIKIKHPESEDAILKILIYFDLLAEHVSINWFLGKIPEEEYIAKIYRWRNEILDTISDCSSHLVVPAGNIRDLRTKEKERKDNLLEVPGRAVLENVVEDD